MLLITLIVGAAFGMILLFTHIFPTVPVTQAVVQTTCTSLAPHPTGVVAAVFTASIFGPDLATGTVLFDCSNIGLFAITRPAFTANTGTANATFNLPCPGGSFLTSCVGYTSISIVTPPSSIPTTQPICSGGITLVSKALITFGTATGNVPTGTYDYCVGFRVSPSTTSLPQFNLNWTQ